jgi:hypothetical protein
LVFQVSHFSKYSCDVEESEQESKADAASVPKKGLGGMPMQQAAQSTFMPKHIPETGLKQGTLDASSTAMWKLGGGDAHFKVSDSVPRFRHSISDQSTPLPRMGKTILENVGSQFGDIEHNPLTPSESNDSETEWNGAVGRAPLEFDSILKDRSASLNVKMMKNMMMMDIDDGARGDTGELQPPIKKSKPSQIRPSATMGELMKKDKAMEIESKGASSFGAAPFVLVPGSRLQRHTEKIQSVSAEPKSAVMRYLPSVIKKEKVKLKPAKKDLFATLRDDVSGTPIRPTPRVCFGPLGFFLTVSNRGIADGSANRSLLNFNRIRSHAEKYLPSTVHRSILEQQLQLELMHHSDPRNILLDQVETLKSVIQSHADRRDPSAFEELIMWELCDILWQNKDKSISRRDKGYLIQQRERLSTWLKRHWRYLFGDVNSDEKSILGLLKKGQKETACKLAVKTSNYTLAAFMAQAVSAPSSAYGARQLELWIQGGAVDFIDKDILEIYKLCCGGMDMSECDFSTMSTAEYLQYFALHLWYRCPLERPVEKIIQSYHMFLASFDAFKKGEKQQKCGPTMYPFKEESSIRNLCVQLLKLYSFRGYAVDLVLNTDVYTTDCMDHRLSWMLLMALRRLGYMCENQELFGTVTSSFAGQLEQLGLGHWTSSSLFTG